MKHLSRDKLAKYHRFSYIPSFYKKDKEDFEHRVSEIKRQLDENVALSDVSSMKTKSSRGVFKRQKSFFLIVLLAAIITTLIVLPLGILATVLLFLFAFAFIKLSKK